MQIVVVIPTYNERDNIVNLINDIFSQPIQNLKVIVVDDNSPDKTSELVSSIQSIYPNLYLIKRYNKLGLGSAYIAGFKKAMALGADLIVEMDADYSHNPKDILRLIEVCTDGFHLAIGSRKIKEGKIVGWNFKRKLMSHGAMVIARFFLRLRTKDVTSGFRCYKREVLEKINLDNVKSNGYAFQEEMLYRTQKNKFHIKEIPVIFTDRKLGTSKLSNKDIVEFFLTIFRLCTTRFDKL